MLYFRRILFLKFNSAGFSSTEFICVNYMEIKLQSAWTESQSYTNHLQYLILSNKKSTAWNSRKWIRWKFNVEKEPVFLI